MGQDPLPPERGIMSFDNLLCLIVVVTICICVIIAAFRGKP